MPSIHTKARFTVVMNKKELEKLLLPLFSASSYVSHSETAIFNDEDNQSNSVLYDNLLPD